MKKTVISLIILIIFTLTGIATTGIINEMAADSRNANRTALGQPVIVYEDTPVVELSGLLEADFLNSQKQYVPLLTVIDHEERVIHHTNGLILDARDFMDIRKAAQHQLVILFVKEETLPRLMTAQTLQQLYASIKGDRYEMKTAPLYINAYPVGYPVDILHEDLLWDVYIDGVSRKDTANLSLSPGGHAVSCPQLVMYTTDPPFKHYNIRVTEQERGQLFYLPEKQKAAFEFLLNKPGDFLRGKTLELVAIRFLPLKQQTIFTEEVLFSGQIENNKTELLLDKGIQYDNLMTLKTRIPDEKSAKELFRKLYPVKNTREGIQFHDSFAFLKEKQAYEIMIGDDNSVSIMDTEWHTELIPQVMDYAEQTWKTAEEFEGQYRKIVITSNRPNTGVYLNDTYIGTAPVTLWLSRTQSYVLEAIVGEASQTVTINPVVEREKIEFEF